MLWLLLRTLSEVSAKRTKRLKRGLFLFMSIQAMAWVIDNSQQTGHGFVTLLMIANHANAEGKKSWPSMKTLARECRLSVRTIQRVILKLEASGELLVDRSAGRSCHSYSIPLMANVDRTVSTLNTPNVDTESTLQRRQPVHVGPERGQSEQSNVDKIDGNVDRAVSTEPYNRNTNRKDPSPHTRLMAFHDSHLVGGIPDAGAQGAAIKWLLERYTPEQCEAEYNKLAGEEWRSTPVTWLTVKKHIGGDLARAVQSAPNGYSPSGEKILTDYGDWYTVMGVDGTPSKRYRTGEAFARETGRNPEEVLPKWN